MDSFEYDYQINVAFNKKPAQFLIFTSNPRKLTYNRQTSTCADVSKFTGCYPYGAAGCTEAPSSYLEGLSWEDHDLLRIQGLSMCYFTVWLLFSPGEVTSDNVKLFGPSKDGPGTV
jgi:hypothetical protein